MSVESARALYDEYSTAHKHFESQARKLEQLLLDLTQSSSLGKSVITVRAKDPLELFKKQLRKRYPDPWTECPDIVGARVVVGTQTEKSEVVRILSESSRVTVAIEDQAVDAKPDLIRYHGLHVHLTSEELKDSRSEPLRCEVQVRTMAEHAWAETEHRYIYKKGSVPDELKRHFNRLLVLMELFDKELVEGVRMAKELPGFRRLELSNVLEHTLSGITRMPSDHALTMETISELENAGFGSSTELLALVNDYVADRSDELAEIINSHGPRAASHDVSRDWIFSQGESVLLLALLDADEYRLSNALQGSDLYAPTEHIALASGHAGFIRD